LISGASLPLRVSPISVTNLRSRVSFLVVLRTPLPAWSAVPAAVLGSPIGPIRSPDSVASLVDMSELTSCCGGTTFSLLICHSGSSSTLTLITALPG
jgi:hypothetical protein